MGLKILFNKLFYLFILFLCIQLVLADAKIEDFLSDDKVEKFIELDFNQKNNILSSASDEQRNDLFKKIIDYLYVKRVKEASGLIAQLTGDLAQSADEKANAPIRINFKGLNNINFHESDESEEKHVISDGRIYLNLRLLPGFVNEVEYFSDNGESKFILRGGGKEIILKEGSTDETGRIKFISERQGVIGHQRFSSELKDYDFSGNVEINSEGFVFSGEKSGIYFKDQKLNIGNLNGTEGKVIFNDNDIDLINTFIYKEDSFAIRPQKDDEPFKVVLSDDFGEFRGKRPSSITFEDAELRKEIKRFGLGYSLPHNEVDVPKKLGEVSVSQGESIGSLIFHKGEDIIDTSQTNLDELKKSNLYRSSSKRLQGILEEMVIDKKRATMDYFERNIFSDEITLHNPDLYKEFTQRSLEGIPAGIAISSPDSRGKIDVFINPGDVGAEVFFYQDIDIMDVYNGGSENARISLISSDGKSSNFILGINEEEFGIHVSGQKSLPSDISIAEIRVRDGSGKYDIKNIKMVENGEVMRGSQLTIYKIKADPLNQRIFLNNNEIPLGTATLRSNEVIKSIEESFERLRIGLETVEGFEGDLENIFGLFNSLNENRDDLISLIPSPEARAFIENLNNGISEEDVGREIESSRIYAENFRRALAQDMRNFIDNPLTVDIRAVVNPNDLPKEPTTFINDIDKIPFRIEVGFSANELKTINYLNEVLNEQREGLSGSELASLDENLRRIDDFYSNLQRSALSNGLNELMLQAIIGRSVELPEKRYYLGLGFEKAVPEDELRLRQRYVDDLSNVLTHTLGNYADFTGGRNTLTIRNNPVHDRVEISFTGREYTPLSIGQTEDPEDGKINPSTSIALRDLLRFSFLVPGPRSGPDYRHLNLYNNPMFGDHVIDYLRAAYPNDSDFLIHATTLQNRFDRLRKMHFIP